MCAWSSSLHLQSPLMPRVGRSLFGFHTSAAVPLEPRQVSFMLSCILTVCSESCSCFFVHDNVYGIQSWWCMLLLAESSSTLAWFSLFIPNCLLRWEVFYIFFCCEKNIGIRLSMVIPSSHGLFKLLTNFSFSNPSAQLNSSYLYAIWYGSTHPSTCLRISTCIYGLFFFGFSSCLAPGCSWLWHCSHVLPAQPVSGISASAAQQWKSLVCNVDSCTLYAISFFFIFFFFWCDCSTLMSWFPLFFCVFSNPF